METEFSSAFPMVFIKSTRKEKQNSKYKNHMELPFRDPQSTLFLIYYYDCGGYC